MGYRTRSTLQRRQRRLVTTGLILLHIGCDPGGSSRRPNVLKGEPTAMPDAAPSAEAEPLRDGGPPSAPADELSPDASSPGPSNSGPAPRTCSERSHHFADAVSYDVADPAAAITTADFDGDGQMDIAVTGGNTASTVSVLLNRGDGSFELLGSYNGGGLFANSVTAADLDADGDPDVVVAHQDFGIAVLLNEGGRSFASPVTYATPLGPSAVVAADLTGDGLPELAVGNTSGVVSVLPNLGGATWGSPVSYPGSPGGAFHAVAVGDVNGDAKGDLIAAHGQIRVRLNAGDGSFDEYGANYSFPDGAANSVVLADLDGDHYLDIAAASFGSPAVNDMAVFLNQRDGSFAPGTPYTTASSPNSIAAGDFNGNGCLDLATLSPSGQSIAVWLDAGGGRFRNAAVYEPGFYFSTYRTQQSALAVADFDSDGRADIAVAAGSAWVLLSAAGSEP